MFFFFQSKIYKQGNKELEEIIKTVQNKDEVLIIKQIDKFNYQKYTLISDIFVETPLPEKFINLDSKELGK